MIIRTTLSYISTLVFTFCLVTACSSNTQSDPANPNQNPPANPDKISIAILPPDAEQPNTLAPDISVDTKGRYHAAYSDIDGRGFYAICQANCSNQTSWTNLEIFKAELDAITGSVTPKLLIDKNNQIHVAFAVNYGNSGIFSKQELYYTNCESNCLNKLNWNIGLAYTHARAQLEAELINYDWFALSADGNPRFVFVDKEAPLIGDEFLYFIACNTNCQTTSNWSKQTISTLNLASTRPSYLKFDSSGKPHLIVSYRVIASASSKLLYFSCLSSCDSTAPVWNAPIELMMLSEDIFKPNAVSFDLLNERHPVLSIYNNADKLELLVMSCTSNCLNQANWQTSNILPDLNLPDDIVSLDPTLTLKAEGETLELAMIAKKREVNVSSLVVKLSCESNCLLSTNWSYETLADTSPFVLDDVGICNFIGTAAKGPVSLLPNAVGFLLFPHWGCSTGPVEVIDADGNRYIDYNADIRFFEIAAFTIQP